MRSPQVWYQPALTALNDPPGASAWPSSLSPQHSTAPPMRSPQVWYQPALTALNDPPGAAA